MTAQGVFALLAFLLLLAAAFGVRAGRVSLPLLAAAFAAIALFDAPIRALLHAVFA
jgi:hypothetical protein